MTRTSTAQATPEAFGTLVTLDQQLAASLGPVLHGLVKLRASQINGCAYCVDLHATHLERDGLPVRTIHGVAAWQESPFFDDAQRAALALTERLTGGIDHVDDALWDEAGSVLGERRRADVLLTIGTITTMNISGITTGLRPRAA
jgi:AhpD family alkylhydroperoxidase